jgi:hypothetical protein
LAPAWNSSRAREVIFVHTADRGIQECHEVVGRVCGWVWQIHHGRRGFFPLWILDSVMLLECWHHCIKVAFKRNCCWRGIKKLIILLIDRFVTMEFEMKISTEQLQRSASRHWRTSQACKRLPCWIYSAYYQMQYSLPKLRMGARARRIWYSC